MFYGSGQFHQVSGRRGERHVRPNERVSSEQASRKAEIDRVRQARGSWWSRMIARFRARGSDPYSAPR